MLVFIDYTGRRQLCLSAFHSSIQGMVWNKSVPGDLSVFKALAFQHRKVSVQLTSAPKNVTTKLHFSPKYSVANTERVDSGEKVATAKEKL